MFTLYLPGSVVAPLIPVVVPLAVDPEFMVSVDSEDDREL